MTALLLLGPWTPLLFQGQEFASSGPFLYFADHAGELAPAVRQGRAEFLAQFPSIAAGPLDQLPDPGDRATFERCKLDTGEREVHADALALHRDLLALRRDDRRVRHRGPPRRRARWRTTRWCCATSAAGGRRPAAGGEPGPPSAT